ncbi:hypothetical protein PGTUg99_026727 [Puccinia graminis f. sp. tritici]|uniref:SAM domain-containing protein n=1 Tax=Puccinia graminis f. sp. tritici TaxID=56615 RepID=A0A5B0P424_PUCGR|nr:hypothetical protein PGTUg99_026727 [Puccinia graminis f. sp. tritici]
MRLDEILHNSTGPPSHYSGTDWVDSALDNLPLTPLTNSNLMTPVDDSFEFLDSNGQRCRRFPAGPNRTLAYKTMRSSVHQSYGPIDDPVAEEAQLLAAHQFRNIYVNPNRSFLTSSSTSVNTNPSGATLTPSFGTRTVQSHHSGHPSESSHQGNLVDPSNNRFHPYPSVATTSQATPKRGAQMANAELTPRGPRLNRPTRGINHSTSPTGLSTVLLDLDDEIDLLEDHSRAPLDSSRQSPQGSLVPENEEALATLPVDRTIMIDFHFHLPVREEATTARKKKTDVPKTRVYKSEAGKVTICWDVSNTDLLSFKSAVITAIVTEAGRSLAGFLERSEGVGNITWYGSIHHGGLFAASQNQQLARPGVFSAWLAACQEVGNKGRKMTCKLHQKDPKDLAENAAALAGLTKLDNPGPSAEPVFQPSTAAIDRAKINEYIGQILATYSPRPRLSGSSDKSVFVNPEKTHDANGYPPTGADSGADGPFSAKSWRVSGYPKGYPWPEGEMAGWKETLPAGEVQVPRRPEGLPSSRRGTSTSSTGRVSFQPTRYKYLVDWKGFLPAGEVQVPRRLEGHPSGRRGTGTSLTGRTPFRSTRYRYLVDWKDTLPVDEVLLVDWKDTLPVDEVQVPRRLEGSPSGRRGTCTSPAGRVSFQPEALPAGPLEGGYPRIPARIPAAADGYPPAGADADSDAQMAGKSSRISGCQLTISTHEYFVISMRVAEAWGKAMHLSPETVDLRTPPKTPVFDYITGPLESDPTPPTTIPQQPAPPYPCPPYPHGYPPPMGYHLQYPYQAAAPATQGLPPPGSPSQDRNQAHGPANAQPDSSPAPSDTEGEDNISSFLSYARVDPNSSAVRDGLAELGITHWSMFRHVQASELMTAGVPMGPARTIVVAAKRYSDRLKSRARARQA